LRAARKEFWDSKDPGAWSEEEKRTLLGQSPWAREGSVRLAPEKPKAPAPTPAGEMPGARPGTLPGGTRSVPIGEKIPPPPKVDTGQPVQFRVLARWESAAPVRLAGGPELPGETAGFYVIRLRGMPLLPPPNNNQSLLEAIKANSILWRPDKPGFSCSHLLTGSGETATELLLFFSRGTDPITVRDKAVTLESRFGPFQMSVKFPLKEMLYRGELAL
jgi:hypothetical protein